MILNQSLDDIFDSDSLKFFPPLILSDVTTKDGQIQQEYDKQRTDFLNSKKYIVLSDSIMIFDSLNNKNKPIATLLPVMNRYYYLTLKSKINNIEKGSKILAQLSIITLVVNNLRYKVNVIYKVDCKNAEYGGWKGEKILYKSNKKWIIEDKS